MPAGGHGLLAICLLCAGLRRRVAGCCRMPAFHRMHGDTTISCPGHEATSSPSLANMAFAIIAADLVSRLALAITGRDVAAATSLARRQHVLITESVITPVAY